MTKVATDPFLEVTDPKDAIGLWSRQVRYEVKITPVWETLRNMGSVTMLDMARWETWDEMLAAMMARDTAKSSAWHLRVWDAQYGRDRPRWFNAWRTHRVDVHPCYDDFASGVDGRTLLGDVP